MTLSPASGTLARVAPLRALLLAALSVALLAPSARAQDAGDEGERTQEVEGDEGADGAAEDGGSYEPDQRGYEPDQRGELDEPPRRDAAPTSHAGEAELASEASISGRDFGLELQIALGGALTQLDVSGTGNLVRPSQRGDLGGGFAFGASARFGHFLVGPRFAVTADPSFVLANLGAGADYLFVRGEIEPYTRVAFGATLVTGLSGALEQQAQSNIVGIGVEAAVGARWRPYRGLILGLELAGVWHHLFRGAVPDCGATCTDGSLDLARPGESDALQLRFSLIAGWAFE